MSKYDAYLTIPSLDISDDLNPGGSVLFYQLSNLSTCATMFSAAVRLFDYARSEMNNQAAEASVAAQHPHEDTQGRIAKIRAFMDKRKSSPPYVSWMGMAARDGGMTLFHALRSMQSIKMTLDRSKDIRERTKVDMKSVDRSLTLFREYFPDIGSIRDAIAHTADIFKNPEKNAVTGGYEGGGISMAKGATGFLIGNFDGNKFTTTGYKGKVLEYEISTSSLSKLIETIAVLFSAFPDRYARGLRPS